MVTVTRSNKSGKGLSRCEDRDDWTYLVQERDMSSLAYWNPTTDTDKSGGLRKSEWPEHVQAGADMFGFAYWNAVRRSNMSDFSGKLVWKVFF
jgi:hypothetical protein